MEMENGAVIDLTMCAFTTGSRTIDIMGTKGEIKGIFSEHSFEIIPFGKSPIIYSTEQVSDGIKMEYDPYDHGGGDKYLIRDMIDLLKGTSVKGNTLTTLDKSLESHFVALAAEKSRVRGGMVVELAQFVNGDAE